MSQPPRPVEWRMPARFWIAMAVIACSLPAAGRSLRDSMTETSRLRHLAFTRNVRTVAVDRSQIPERLRAEMVRTLPYSLDDYVLILRTLCLVDSDAQAGPLITSFLELLQSQVLAYYDPLSHTYFAIRPPGPSHADHAPSAHAPYDAPEVEEAVAVHELTHALQDQHFNIGQHDLAIQNDWDASLAYHAVLEGDASLVMMASMLEKTSVSLEQATASDTMADALAAAAGSDKGIDPSAPRYFVESLKFPYIQGLRFVMAAYRRGGWAAIDRLYADPPVTTSEILHPDAYFARVARHEPAARFPANDHRPGVLTIEHLGAFHWSFLLGNDVGKGWSADRVTILQNDWCEPTTLLETEWETEAGAENFATAYSTLLEARGLVARWTRSGRTIRLAYGADAMKMQQFLTP